MLTACAHGSECIYICAHAPMRCVSGHFCAGAACTGGPATRDARYRAAERVNVCAGPSSVKITRLYKVAECGTALRAPPAPPVDVKVQGVASRAVPWAWESVTSRRWRGARARGTAGRVPGTQDPREP